LGKGVRLSAIPLAFGNTVVMLPSEESPLMALRLAKVYEEAGLPPGCFNVVTGFGHEIGDALTGHPLVRSISFTGSTRVGTHIRELAARSGKKLTLELGGKSPLVVLDDADLSRAVQAAVQGSFGNQGQICMASSRIYVQRGVSAEFLARFAASASSLGMGDLHDPATLIGPIINARQRARIKAHVDDAIAQGATVVSGGGWVGHRCQPTVLTGVTPGMLCHAEETFGPVTSVYVVDSLDEALRYFLMSTAARRFRGNPPANQCILSTQGSGDLLGRPLNFRAIVLQGDPSRIVIKSDPAYRAFQLTIPWQPPEKTSPSRHSPDSFHPTPRLAGNRPPNPLRPRGFGRVGRRADFVLVSLMGTLAPAVFQNVDPEGGKTC
jgi:hypothetical protein